MQSSLNNILFLLCFIFLCSCAQIIPPTGGPKDTEKPQVVISSPINGSTQFNGNKIVLYFNEYISLKNPQNLLISPPVLTKPELSVKRKNLEITFKEDLQPNTTYQVTLSDMISDITEGNTYELFTFSFSTGNQIDSAVINGEVLNAYSLEPLPGITIALYTEKPDTALLGKVPRYITRSFANGKFSLEHLAEGNYYVVAYRDDNNNLRSDKNELFGFYGPQVSTLIKDIPTPLLLSQMRNKEHEYLTDCYKLSANKLLIHHTDPAVISNLQKKFPFPYSQLTGTRKDSVYIFSFSHNISVKDSLIFCRDTSKKSVVIEALSDLRFINANDTLQFVTANNAIIQNEKISITEDSLVLDPREIIKENLRFSFPWKHGKKYTITFDSFAIIDPDHRFFNTKISFSFSCIKPEQATDLHFIIDNKNNLPLLYELIAVERNNTVVLRSAVSSSKTIHATQLQPGKYLIKLVHDVNQNGYFDEGNFILQQDPEQIVLSDIIELKPNWEVTDVIVGFPK